MIRSPRRVVSTQQPQTPARTALEYELTDSWPAAKERSRFWAGPTVPEHLRFYNAPDPRKVLTGEEGRLEHEAECAVWQSARLSWLRREARG